MKHAHSIRVIIKIDASPEAVWDALTNPEMIRQYLFGTEAVSDWEKGSPLIFRGEHEGQSYFDKGEILESEPGRLLRYTYLSSMSGMEDVPENYMILSFHLQEQHEQTELTLVQENIASQEAATHSEHNWAQVLEALKKLMETE